MPVACRITFAESAVQDMEGIRSWYADQDLPAVGDRIIQEIISSIQRLASFPESGLIVPEFNIAHLREIIHPPFRIVYRLDKKRVRIVRVWRSEQLLHLPEAGQ